MHVLHTRLLVVYGDWQRDVDSGGQVPHLIADHLRDLTPSLGTSRRDFH